MNAIKNAVATIPPISAAASALVSIACFHIAYAAPPAPVLHLAAFFYFVFLFQLTRLPTGRQAFYSGLATALACIAPQLAFFWKIFGAAAITLWLVLALWIALFVCITRAILRRFGTRWTLVLAPCFWIALEYTRSELYYLKFSWANIGCVLGGVAEIPTSVLGIYGISFLGAFCGAAVLTLRWRAHFALCFAIVLCVFVLGHPDRADVPVSSVRIAGVQLEFPLECSLPGALDSLITKHPEAQLLVLSEYTLNGTVPDSLKKWCRDNKRHLIVGGKEASPSGGFFNTAFVVGPDGTIVFKQAKSVPIQFFKDGHPALGQAIWNSPWGRIGIAICYDLSYTRVMDRLVCAGAQLLVVPTMDVADWGLRQHELHALVGPVRAREYGLPVFRLASSGISQAIDRDGSVQTTAGFPGENATIYAELQLPRSGSLPIDRWLALLSIGISVAALIAFALPARSLPNAKLAEDHVQQIFGRGLPDNFPNGIDRDP
ncbi:MAG TPA: nitrilase-related carbon-nitrogen hydrolase [Verrucomicrobiae bacterium]|nr:nitrilase-related carbon-nitrogen hydrolase [Verrucomicrobiae bacterium]